MQIVAVYEYSIRELGDYLAGRIPPGIYLPLAAFLAVAAFAATSSAITQDWLWTVGLAFTLVLQFRLWDDIADLGHDRIQHPDRLLCRTANIRHFYYVAGSLALINAVLITFSFQGWDRIGGFLTLCLGLLAWYHWRPRESGYFLLNGHVVLLKYPAVVWLITPELEGGPGGRLNFVCCLLSVYLIFAMYEILHDQRSRALNGVAGVLGGEMILLTSTWVVIAWGMRESATSGLLVVWAGVVSSTVLLSVFHLFRMGERPNRSVYGYFPIGCIAYIGLSLETLQ